MTNMVWLVSGMKNGFVWKVLIRTTEEKLHKYMETELPTATSYTGATEKEVNAANLLGMPIYCY